MLINEGFNIGISDGGSDPSQLAMRIISAFFDLNAPSVKNSQNLVI